MTASEFFSDRLGSILVQAVSAATAAVFLLATGTSSGVVVLLLIAGAIVLFAAQAAGYLRLRAQLEELENIVDGLDKKYLFAECAPPPKGPYERRVFAMARRAGRAMATEVSDAQAAQREYREYVERWVHEVKAPITAARLICGHVEPDTRRRLERELAQIDAHVERALFYARAENPEKDFVLRAANLSELAGEAIQGHRALLIQNGVRVDTQNLEHTVYTDGKWVCFILGQLLQNAARYRGGQPVVTLSARALGQQVQLTVADNGIGIPAHELPRVFDRGFTGSNGRARGGSTGMGLYLAKKLADALDIGLQAASEEGLGTSFTLTFPAKVNLTKL